MRVPRSLFQFTYQQLYIYVSIVGMHARCKFSARFAAFSVFDTIHPHSYKIPHGSASVRGIPQLRSYDVTMPNWVDTSVPEQRMHLRLYYSDMLAAKPVSPPVVADCDTWEVRGRLGK